jgi:Domain of unknown function (DUF5615)
MIPMLRFAADENFNNDIVRGVLRRSPNVDIVRVQDAGLSNTDDPIILEWAAAKGRVFLTHDVSTITRYVNERVQNGLPMPGIFQVTRKVPIGVAIEEILLLAECSLDGEWEGQVRYLPLRWASPLAPPPDDQLGDRITRDRNGRPLPWLDAGSCRGRDLGEKAQLQEALFECRLRGLRVGFFLLGHDKVSAARNQAFSPIS